MHRLEWATFICSFKIILVLNWTINVTSAASNSTSGLSPNSKSQDKEESVPLGFKSSGNASLDRLFMREKKLFQDHLKTVDLTIIPGYRRDEYLDDWVPPLDIQRDLPNYLSGFDSQNQPIWVMEWGRFKFSKYATGGKKAQALCDKYFRYLALVKLKSCALKSTPDHQVYQHVVIVDFEHLRLDVLTNRQTLQYQMKIISDNRRFFEKYVSKFIFINVNPLSEVLLNVARPFIIRLVDRMEVYGTNKAVWEPQLVKHLPKDQIPEWYGGSKSFQPVLVIG